MEKITVSPVLKEAYRITRMLDTVLGDDRFDRAPVQVEVLALEYSAQIAADTPIHEVSEKTYLDVWGRWFIATADPDNGVSFIITIKHQVGAHTLLHMSSDTGFCIGI